MNSIRVRFAPSPTGYLHIGGARTALFNRLFADRYKGQMVLRIEDTDTERLKEDSISQILESLNWLGIKWDEGPCKGGSVGPYFQSQRIDLYQEAAKKLLEENKAYMCFCTSDDLDKEREIQRLKKLPFRYARTCRELDKKEIEERIKKGENPVIRLKNPLEGDVNVHDLIHGEVIFNLNQLDDFIILKSNGMPTYNFACVIDDHAMSITHILRAEEHLSNTPKQILVYNAMGYDVPDFGHMPMILAPDRSKLSKRHGATSVEEYKKEGFLPETIINYLTLLGWTPKDENEFFSMEETAKDFSLNQITKKAAVYDVKKLTWMNGQYLSSLPLEKIYCYSLPFFIDSKILDEEYIKNNESYLKKIVDLVRIRVKTLVELVEGARFFFEDIGAYDEKGVKKYFSKDTLSYLLKIKQTIESLDAFDIDTLEEVYNETAEKLGVKLGVLVHPTRLALTGKTVSPGLFEVMFFLGKEKTCARISAAINYMVNKVV